MKILRDAATCAIALVWAESGHRSRGSGRGSRQQGLPINASPLGRSASGRNFQDSKGIDNI